MRASSSNRVDGKAGLRRALRQRRRQLTPQAQRQAAHDLAAQLQQLDCFCASRAIAMYLANDGEIDPRRAMEWCWSREQRCYVPVLAETAADGDVPRELRFAEITADTKMRRNRFGIAEPALAPDSGCVIGARDLDLVLLPLVGFDRRGNRIGMGGGFYDATFAFQRTASHTAPHLIGLAHELQRVERVAADNWDIPIAAVVTDQRVYHCQPETEPQTE